MTSFITRVELHGARWPEDYATLHRSMAALNFHRTIIGDDGVEYHLPTATYRSYGNLSMLDVREHAKEAARRTGWPYEIIVTEERWSCWELRPVRPSLGALNWPRRAPVENSLAALIR